MRSFKLVLAAALLAVTAGCGTTPTSAPVQNPAEFAGAPGGGLLLAGDGLSAPLPSGGDAGTLAPAIAAEAGPGACIAWNEFTRDLAQAAALPPPLFARAYALEGVAVHDAVELSVRGKAQTSQDLLVATAAAEVLRDLFPAAVAAIGQRVTAAEAAAQGNSRGAIARARALGALAGRAAVRHAHSDGSDHVWTGTIPTGDCVWTGSNPLLPMAGTWRTWIASSGSEFMPEPPYECVSPADLRDLEEVETVATQRTDEQIAIVHKWADTSPPAIWNGMSNQSIVDARLGLRSTARLQAYMNMGIYDAFVTCWNCKFQFWMARPTMRSPGLTTVVPTPNFPTYTSGHATISAAAAEVLADAFPGNADYYRAQAQEAAMSRLWAGIHFRHDNEQGAVIGGKIGLKVAEHMRAEAARADDDAGAMVAARD